MFEKTEGKTCMTSNWKTTAAGALSAFAVTVGPLSSFLATVQAIEAQIPGHAPANYTLAIVGAALTTAAAIARLWIGLIQEDAKTIATSTTTITGTTANVVTTPTVLIQPEPKQ